MNHDQHTRLVAALHEHAAGITATVAAVGLIADHRIWLTAPTSVRSSNTDTATAPGSRPR